jgi:manganese oxidase
VLRVQAGDCLNLTVVNALPAPASDRRCYGDRSGDAPGDALMPRIVPLNVDCDGRQYHGSQPFEGGSTNSNDVRDDIIPSHRVALSLPLPATGDEPAGALPVGVNVAEALPQASPATAPATQSTQYYAGFFWPDPDQVAKHAAGEFKRLTADPSFGPLAQAGARTLRPLAERACDASLQVMILSTHLCMTLDQNLEVAEPVDSPELRALRAARSRVQSALDAHFAQPDVYHKVVRVIPYAYGALPIRSVADVISHGAHGLLGTLIVEARPPGAMTSPATDFAYRHATARRIEAPCLPLGSNRDTPVPAALCGSGGAPQPGETVPGAVFMEHALAWQDGLNLRRQASPSLSDLGLPGRPVPNCLVCDDSYDLGEKGVSYRSEPFAFRLAGANHLPLTFGLSQYPRNEDDLNRALFPAEFFAPPAATPNVTARSGEEIAIRIVHSTARARQRAFVPTFTGYDDLFPGFGSGHSALIGPGKALTAWGRAPCTTGRYLWRDGPQPMFASGVWGHLTVEGPADPNTRCDLTP